MLNRLSCQVTSCLHNESNLCCLSKIKVDGPSASSSSGTCCASFAERNNSASNSTGNDCACPETKIDCKAEKCTYNDNCKCEADNVNVGCCCHAPKSMSETECDTFKCC